MESHGSALVKENSIAGLCLGSGNPQNSRVRFTLVAEPQARGIGNFFGNSITGGRNWVPLSVVHLI